MNERLDLANRNIGTVITCFPDTWKPEESYNLKNVVMKQLNDPERPVIKSVESLFDLILKTALDFMPREGPLEAKFKESFQSSINHIVSPIRSYENSTGNCC
jgi:hypothetical protein